MQTNKMMRFYRAILWEVGITYNLNPDDIHDVINCWYKIETTTKLNFEQWKDHIDNVIIFIACVFDMLFDSEGYKLDKISRVRLHWAMKPDNWKNLWKI